MIIDRFFFLAVAMAACAVAAFAIRRYARYLEMRQLEEDLRTWAG